VGASKQGIDLFKNYRSSIVEVPDITSFLFGLKKSLLTLCICPYSQQGYELPSRLNQPMRLASLQRFREKRKERNYDKKIRYSVRKEVAQR
jgi:hypothetical protein